MKKALCLLIAGVIGLAWGGGWYIEATDYGYGGGGQAALIVVAASMTIGGAVMTAVKYKSK